VCRGFSLVLLSGDRAVVSVYSFREERVDWGALAREILADIEEFTGARVAEVALKAAAALAR